MPDTSEQKAARKALRRIQGDFERKVAEARQERRACFEQAQRAGLSLREIADEVGLHYTRVGEVLRDKQKS